MYSRLTPEQNLALFIRVAKAIIATGRGPRRQSAVSSGFNSTDTANC